MIYEEVLLQELWKWEELEQLIDDIHGLFLEGMSSPEITKHIADSLLARIVPAAKASPKPIQSLTLAILENIDFVYVAKDLVESVVQEMVSSSRDRWNRDSYKETSEGA
jgi:hypothetical protein